MKKLSITVFIILSCAACFGQSGFQDITPGVSSRSEVVRVLGQPVRSISATTFEYSPPAGIAKVEVEYRSGSEIVERIEVYFQRPLSRSALIQQFGLPQSAEKNANTNGALVEYFGGASLLALTYASAEPSSGITHIGYYSRELFERVSGITSGATQPSNPARGHGDCFVGDPGMSSTSRIDHNNWAQHQTAARLEANLANKINLLFNCPSMSNDQLSSAFAELSVCIAHWLHNYTCVALDPGSLSEDLSGHKEWARTRSRSELINNLQWKMRTALKCMGPSGPRASLFAASSVVIAKATL